MATPLDPWVHDLTAIGRFTELWPLLLVIALLLWPIDIALRRVSIGRREFASAGAWVRGIGHRQAGRAHVHAHLLVLARGYLERGDRDRRAGPRALGAGGPCSS